MADQGVKRKKKPWGGRPGVLGGERVWEMEGRVVILNKVLREGLGP